MLNYMKNARFYRVDKNEDQAFVVQFGYNGSPLVDNCWDDHLTSNTTWSVHQPGNIRGTVSFSMNYIKQNHKNPNCTADDFCAIGFSTNIFINYGDNTRLDKNGFSVFGVISDQDMEIVDALYDGYGEVSDLCQESGDPFCKGIGDQCEGVSMSRLLVEGNNYVQKEKPLLDYIYNVIVLPWNGLD
eukprot:TRINITY_DN1874_c1_g2_i1.p1 TRINITY_DN1874_c1_g2~~TRINITY_DN1874_c1_g2_i1.p1  ORF type:complete len:186 (-),score=31.21 TRINITY_DN1874_c1_g2_i1:65-622(-)